MSTQPYSEDGKVDWNQARLEANESSGLNFITCNSRKVFTSHNQNCFTYIHTGQYLQTTPLPSPNCRYSTAATCSVVHICISKYATNRRSMLAGHHCATVNVRNIHNIQYSTPRARNANPLGQHTTNTTDNSVSPRCRKLLAVVFPTTFPLNTTAAPHISHFFST
jgi:hypothetical protein